MILFGPAGNSKSFYDAGYKHTYEAFAWIADMGLTAYEYSFGRGVRITQQTAELIGQKAKENDITLSVHAPYYINFATGEKEKAQNNLRYLSESARAAKWMGAKRVVFHPGSQMKMERDTAFAKVKEGLEIAIGHLENEQLWDIQICPETMGKIKQIGDLEEVIELCRLDERIVPAIDFGHLHARAKGGIKTAEDYAHILDRLEESLGGYRAKRFHVHFSKIEYTAAGEKMHRSFADEGYGPEFSPLARQIAWRDLSPVMICESKGTMAEDAVEMKRIYAEELLKL